MSTTLNEAIKSRYAATARSPLTNNTAGVAAVAEAFGYTSEELTSIPAAANMGLSCGNPVATAHLKPGEVVVDLGSGGGLDVFLAAQRVGPTGRAIGIDMTPDMIARARKAAATGNHGQPITNVDFHLAEIDRLPLPDSTVDVILSNCVINLAPDKPAVFREMFRVLKPGGRVAVSDIALKHTLPDELAADVHAYVGCIAGAIHVLDYEQGLINAGFQHVVVVDSNSDLNAYALVEGQSGCCSPTAATPTPPAPTATTPSAPQPTPAASCCTPAPAGSSACCTPTKLPLSLATITPTTTSSSCCGGASTAQSPTSTKAELHAHLGDLMRRYDINHYAASVKVFAVKPR